MKRVGLLGGTFDPPHKGHFSIAKAAVDSLRLDEIWFIPTYESPHKREAATDSEHRLQMLKLMIAEERNFHIKTIELERKGKSYTIDTMDELLTTYPDVQFYFIIGADQVKSLHKWHRIEQLLEKVKFVGVERPGVDWHETIEVTKLAAPKFDVASTTIRNNIKQGQSVDQFVHPDVYAYVKEHRLYGYSKHS